MTVCRAQMLARATRLSRAATALRPHARGIAVGDPFPSIEVDAASWPPTPLNLADRIKAKRRAGPPCPCLHSLPVPHAPSPVPRAAPCPVPRPPLLLPCHRRQLLRWPEQDVDAMVKLEALLQELRKRLQQISHSLEIARGRCQPLEGNRGQAPRATKSHCATTLVHCMSGRGFLQNGPAKEDSINDMLLM